MKILLLVVENRDEIKTEYCKFLTHVAWNRLVSGITFWSGGRPPVWYMRQQMLRKALENKETTHVLFVDTDVIPQLDCVGKLAAHNLPLVSGVYCDTNGAPINRKNGTPFIGKNLMEVDVFSMGLSLISREVLEKVEYPEPDPIVKPDADVEFCRNVKATGFKIMTDFNVRGAHLLFAPFLSTYSKAD